jgi:hypothetical protein
MINLEQSSCLIEWHRHIHGTTIRKEYHDFLLSFVVGANPRSPRVLFPGLSSLRAAVEAEKKVVDNDIKKSWSSMFCLVPC